MLPRSAKSERQTAFVVVAVTTYSTIAMVLYPVLARALGFDDHTTGILLGATIHDVAQVVGAGYAVSPEAGDTATIVKLLRVALLLPIVFVIALAIPRERDDGGSRAVACLRSPSALWSQINSLRPPAPACVRWAHRISPGACSLPSLRSEFEHQCEMLKMGSEAMGVPAAAALALLTLLPSSPFIF